MSYALTNPYLENYWNCISCNYHNKGTRTHCNRCRVAKQIRNPGDWNCLACDQLLPLSRDRCDDCGITKNGLPIPQQNESQTSSSSTVENTSAENTSAENTTAELCSICLTNPKNSIFLHGDTAHQAACYTCARQCNNRCPLCRQNVDKVIKLY